jgi:glycolate oxidase FAD binding subunit
VDSEVCCIDGFAPLPVVRPGSVAEAAEVVRRARSKGKAVYPVGGMTQLGVGLPPHVPGVALRTTALCQVIDYPARDMTITTGAGITMTELQKLLATENQRLPIDVARSEAVTLGGALATNASGPRRLGWGTLRDYVIGISTLNDEGHEVKAGGRVVKNVAGYDLCKLHVGALGTLGLITQVTLKVRPRPEAEALITFGCDAEELPQLLDRVHQSRTRPVCVDVLNRGAARRIMQQQDMGLPEAAWVILVGFEESESAVKWQVQQLIKELPATTVHGLEARAGSATGSLWQALVEATAPTEAQLSFKANLLPSAVAGFCHAADRLADGGQIQAHAGSGIVLGHVRDSSLEKARALVDRLHEEAAAAQGNVVIPHAPAAWKRELPVWGMPRGDLALMRRVKEQLDPRRLFNPGRYVGGI